MTKSDPAGLPAEQEDGRSGDEALDRPIPPAQASDTALDDGVAPAGTLSIERLEAFRGPLPHPALFAQYDQVQPGFAERIMRMTEKQLQHQIGMAEGEQELRRKVVDAEIRSFTRAQWFTFVLVLVFLGLAGAALFVGQTLGAVAAGLAALATIAYALHGRRRAEREVEWDDDGEQPDEAEHSR